VGKWLITYNLKGVIKVEGSEHWTTFVPLLISVWCPHCGHQVERLVVLRQSEAEIIKKALEHKFAGIITVQILRGEELIDYIRGRR